MLSFFLNNQNMFSFLNLFFTVFKASKQKGRVGINWTKGNHKVVWDNCPFAFLSGWKTRVGAQWQPLRLQTYIHRSWLCPRLFARCLWNWVPAQTPPTVWRECSSKELLAHSSSTFPNYERRTKPRIPTDLLSCPTPSSLPENHSFHQHCRKLSNCTWHSLCNWFLPGKTTSNRCRNQLLLAQGNRRVWNEVI